MRKELNVAPMIMQMNDLRRSVVTGIQLLVREITTVGISTSYLRTGGPNNLINKCKEIPDQPYTEM